MKKLSLLCALIIMIIIFYFSNIPNLHFVSDVELPLWLKRLIKTSYIKLGIGGFFSYTFSLHPDFIIHKLGHIGLYGLLGISLFFAFKQSVQRALLFSCIFAISDEIHQSYIIGRSARFGDILLDTMAALGFILLVRCYVRR